MTTSITSTGMVRDRLDQVIANIQAAFRSIFGSDIDLNESSLDGQLIGALGEQVDELGQIVEQAYLSRSVAGATGAALSRLVLLNGISRNPASYSTATVTFGGAPGTVIPAGSLVDTTAVPPAHFQTVGDVTLDGSGAATGTVRATTTGPVVATVGAISVPKTVISGWTAVTNPAAVNLGSDVETDAALRVRQRASVAIAAKSVIDSIYAALANVAGVSETVVFENRTGSPVSRPGSTDLPPNSIQCVVRGGLNAAVATAIWSKASAGVTLVGAVAETVTDAQGFAQVIKFDRPTDVAIWALVVIVATGGTPVTEAHKLAIKQALVDFGNAQARIGKKIIWSALFGPVSAAATASGNGNITPVNISINTTPGTLFAIDLAIPFTGRASWDVGRVSMIVSNLP